VAAGDAGACPIIGDRVDIGANSVILGPIRIGSDAVIGAGSVVVKDVPAGATVVGNPARVIRACRADGVEGV
jgi:putative colanic acid biosynthesis acetyltransferase WcaB